MAQMGRAAELAVKTVAAGVEGGVGLRQEIDRGIDRQAPVMGIGNGKIARIADQINGTAGQCGGGDRSTLGCGGERLMRAMEMQAGFRRQPPCEGGRAEAGGLVIGEPGTVEAEAAIEKRPVAGHGEPALIEHVEIRRRAAMLQAPQRLTLRPAQLAR